MVLVSVASLWLLGVFGEELSTEEEILLRCGLATLASIDDGGPIGQSCNWFVVGSLSVNGVAREVRGR